MHCYQVHGAGSIPATAFKIESDFGDAVWWEHTSRIQL